MRVLRALLVVLVLLCAPLFVAQGIANSRQSPALLGWNGFWQANVARQFVMVQMEAGQPVMAIRDGGIDLAKDAFAKEPFATDALFLIASSLRANGAENEAATLVTRGLSLDKRNRYLGAMDIQTAVTIGDFDLALAGIERLYRTSPSLSDGFLNAFKTILAQDGAEDIMLRALERRPVWANAFWTMVPPEPESVRRLYNLRLLTDEGTSEDTDARLLAGLAATEQYATVFALWDYLNEGSGNPTGFVATGGDGTLGWQVPEGETGHFSERGNGEFRLFVDARESRELARQLVRLQPGRYAFSADFSPKTAAENFTASVQCAVNSPNEPIEQSLSTAAEFVISDQCAFYWLVLTGNAWERRTPLEATVSNMQLVGRD
ncbi:hypothetical protein GRI62_07170 [Erythrobacter arachoides]|uniref:Tetratricopeptide repeat protein n=1 Tax=Aurantiacibacter arachoides TaxID=1850444 RepID=A0A845A0Y8_9SPHN|nr:hypothetical protein [Aurantiacibacter arachoides]MXO93384.1 hypothetical protein [Aurantiacibacter arachoides]GGD49774.1 hypothetical protein GCM10011411_06980 [Aurantiacibacter arachoides]